MQHDKFLERFLRTSQAAQPLSWANKTAGFEPREAPLRALTKETTRTIPGGF